MKSLFIRLLGGLLAVGNIGLTYQLVWGKNGIIELGHQQNVYAEMLQNDDQLQETGRKMSAEIRQLGGDPFFLEQTIRRELNFLKENEVLYLLPGSEGDR